MNLLGWWQLMWGPVKPNPERWENPMQVGRLPMPKVVGETSPPIRQKYEMIPDTKVDHIGDNV